MKFIVKYICTSCCCCYITIRKERLPWKGKQLQDPGNNSYNLSAVDLIPAVYIVFFTFVQSNEYKYRVRSHINISIFNRHITCPTLPPSSLTPSPQYNQFTMAKILFYSLFSWTSATQILVVHKWNALIQTKWLKLPKKICSLNGPGLLRSLSKLIWFLMFLSNHAHFNTCTTLFATNRQGSFHML